MSVKVIPMPDAFDICFQISAQCKTYAIGGAWCTMWNFRFMDNLFQFGKDFR